MKKQYPKDFSDKELEEEVTSFADYPIGVDHQLAISKYMKAMVGLIDLQGRQNKRIQFIFFFFAALQFIVAGLDFVLNITNTENKIISGFIAILFLFAMIWLVRDFKKESDYLDKNM